MSLYCICGVNNINKGILFWNCHYFITPYIKWIYMVCVSDGCSLLLCCNHLFSIRFMTMRGGSCWIEAKANSEQHTQNTHDASRFQRCLLFWNDIYLFIINEPNCHVISPAFSPCITNFYIFRSAFLFT